MQLVLMNCWRFAHSEARGHHHILQEDKQQQAEKSGIKTERAQRYKYTSFFPEGGQIEAADVASWETLSKTSQQAADDKLV